MMRNTLSILGPSISILAFVLVGGCDNPFASCTEGFDCPGDGDGPRSGGTSNSGGKAPSDGGADSTGGLGGGGNSSGGLGNVGGTGQTGGNGSGGENLGGACGDTCTDEAPHCIEDEATCVECTKHAHCEDETAPVCGLTNTCDRCKSDGDCKDVLGLADKPVCITDTDHPDYGSCIGCLDEEDCGGNICDSDTDSCLDLKFRKKSVCAPCEHDLECMVGEYCVPQVFNGMPVGNFCTQTKEARVGINGSCLSDPAGPPFVDTKTLTSLGGETLPFCVLATTTCPAYSDHRQQKAECNAETSQADAACGAPSINDGLCRKKENDPTFLCTYRCGDDVDCLIKGTQYECIDSVEPAYCAI